MPAPRPVTKAVIPAAGLGTRFLPATKASPKEMLPVVDKPAIQYVVEEAVRAGLDDVLMVTGRNKRPLEDHFDRNVELEHALQEKGDLAKLALVHEASQLGQVGPSPAGRAPARRCGRSGPRAAACCARSP
jgi:UTP--glucose-1-phosphate uridylyltransferase